LPLVLRAQALLFPCRIVIASVGSLELRFPAVVFNPGVGVQIGRRKGIHVISASFRTTVDETGRVGLGI